MKQSLARMVLFAGIAACSGPAGADDSITSGCSGGITGGGYGVTVERDGRIYRWHAPTSHDARDEVEVRNDPTEASQLFASLDEMGFVAMGYQETGDMTCSLTVVSGESEHAVTWPHGQTGAPAEARAMAERLLAFLEPE